VRLSYSASGIHLPRLVSTEIRRNGGVNRLSSDIRYFHHQGSNIGLMRPTASRSNIALRESRAL